MSPNCTHIQTNKNTDTQPYIFIRTYSRRKYYWCPKTRNNYSAMQLITYFIHPNNGLFSIAPYKVITPNCLCFIFSVISLLLSLIPLTIIIDLPAIVIDIVVALSRS